MVIFVAEIFLRELQRCIQYLRIRAILFVCAHPALLILEHLCVLLTGLFNIPANILPFEALIGRAVVVDQVHVIGPETEQHDAYNGAEDAETYSRRQVVHDKCNDVVPREGLRDTLRVFEGHLGEFVHVDQAEHYLPAHPRSVSCGEGV